MIVIIPVDGSDFSDNAVRHIIKLAQSGAHYEIHLLSVQIPVSSGHVKMFVSQDQINDYYHEEGLKALASARALLDGEKIACQYHIGVGRVAETIVAYSKEKHCDQIIMGTRGAGAISNFVIGSVATKVIHLSEMPVTLVK